ncbi:putative GPI-anchored protein [Capsicum galapagoense]
MRGGVPQSFKLYLLHVFLLLLYLQDSSCSSVNSLRGSLNMDRKEDVLLPEISPTASPQPFLPLLAPSPWAPFTNSTLPKLSGLCTLKFDAVESMMGVTSIDCVAPFAQYLANVMCCPQLETTLVILIGQSSKYTKMLALNSTLATHCLSDFQQILVSQGANDTLPHICSLHPSNLTEGSCPVKDVREFETTVDSSSLLAACKKIDLVNECCEQTCENAISEAAKKLALKAYDLLSMEGAEVLSDHSTRVNDCRRIAHRWLASKLDPSGAKDVLRGLSNCKNNKVCPLVFPNASHVAKACGHGPNNQTACCNTIESYVSHLQRQSFVTNLQALDCAASLGVKLQKANVSKNIYNLCHITLKDFSVQVAPEVSGCLLPSLPSDAVLDQISGISFVCDLNDNIPAPWPSLSQLPVSSCNKTVKIPALPAAASGQISLNSLSIGSHLRLLALTVLGSLFYT